MAGERRPNSALRGLLAEAHWTEEVLAKAVNHLAAEIGLRLRYDRTAVSHWLSGTRPRPPVPELIAEALGRKLSRRVTVVDTGFCQAPGSASFSGDDGPDTLLTNLAALQARAPADRGRPLAEMPYRLGGLAVPVWARELQAFQPSAPKAPARTDAATVTAVEAMAQVFASSDAAFGGGKNRHALAAYLAQDLVPRLVAAAQPAIRRRLYQATAEMSYLCGFMCFDEELNGLAQNYYLTALRLAATADDQSRYAVTLRAMSVQAQRLGHCRHAVQLAEAAAAAGKASDPARQAFLYGQLAVACAGDHDRINAFAALSAAERRLDRASSAHLIGAYHAASLAHTEAKVRALLCDYKGASGTLVFSIRHRPAVERRARVITLASLGHLQLRQGRLDEATATWNAFLQEYPEVICGRADTALKMISSAVRPYAKNRSVKAFIARANSLHPTRQKSRSQAATYRLSLI